MIDNRQIKEFDHVIEDDLQGITDTEVLLNFQQAITNLYPHLIPIYSFAYDPWDNIVERLFYQMVYKTFSFKYGIDIKWEEAYRYEYSLGCSKEIHHIECIPKYPKFKALANFEWIEIDEKKLQNKVLVFKCFGDGEHSISGGLEFEKAKNVKFDLVEVKFASALTGETELDTVYIHKDDLDFEFVAETYTKRSNRNFFSKLFHRFRD